MENYGKIPVVVKRERFYPDNIYLILFGDDENGKKDACCLTGTATRDPMTFKKMSLSTYQQLVSVKAEDAVKWVDKFCEHFHLDRSRYVPSVKLPTSLTR